MLNKNSPSPSALLPDNGVLMNQAKDVKEKFLGPFSVQSMCSFVSVESHSVTSNADVHVYIHCQWIISWFQERTQGNKLKSPAKQENNETISATQFLSSSEKKTSDKRLGEAITSMWFDVVSFHA